MQNSDSAIRETDRLFDIFLSVLNSDNLHPESIDKVRVSAANPVKECTAKEYVEKEISVENTDVDKEDERFSMDFEMLRKVCYSCERCSSFAKDLVTGRKNVLFGKGYEALVDVFVVVDRPSELKNEKGNLLSKMLKSISLDIEFNCYITSLLKCNSFSSDESLSELPVEVFKTCSVYLKQQIALIQPKSILCFGKNCLTYLMDESSQFKKEQGKFILYDKSIPLICTSKPSEIMRNEELKRVVWEDLKKLARLLNLRILGKK